MAVDDGRNGMVLEFEGVLIVGGGIGGLATALALHRVGLKSLVLEQADSLRVTGAALLLWSNAWKALDALGIAHLLRPTYPPFHCQRMVSVEDGLDTEISFRNQEVRCLERRVLLETLAAALPAETIRFNSKVVDVFTNGNSGLPTAQLADGTCIRPKVLIGCDGINSVISRWLGIQPARLMGRTLTRALSTFPQGHGFEPEFCMKSENGLRVAYLPINDKDVYWFLSRNSLPGDSETTEDSKLIIQEAIALLRYYPEEYRDVVQRTLADSATLAHVRFRWPWTVLFGKLCKGTVTLAGDAMHAMPPYIGQGGCSTLEDAVIFSRCLAEEMNRRMINAKEEEKGRLEKALKKYVKERRWRVVMLITNSYLTGLLQPGSGRLRRFLREKIVNKIFRNALGHIEYDCGSLQT